MWQGHFMWSVKRWMWQSWFIWIVEKVNVAHLSHVNCGNVTQLIYVKFSKISVTAHLCEVWKSWALPSSFMWNLEKVNVAQIMYVNFGEVVQPIFVKTWPSWFMWSSQRGNVTQLIYIKGVKRLITVSHASVKMRNVELNLDICLSACISIWL